MLDGAVPSIARAARRRLRGRPAGVRFGFLVSATLLPAGPTGAPLLGHMTAFRRDPLGFLLATARGYPGELVRFRQGPRTVYLVKHPDLVKEVLVTRQHEFTKSRAL